MWHVLGYKGVGEQGEDGVMQILDEEGKATVTIVPG
jgi:hypothetical protein